VDATQEALAAAQQALGAGDAEGAREHFDKMLGLADTEERKGEIHLSLAEMTWQAGEKSLALEHYAAARRIAKEAGDAAKEGMISLGLGFALLNSGDDSDLGAALEAMRRSLELAEAQGHAPQANFVASLIAQAERRKDLAQRSEEEEQAAMLKAFVSSLVGRSPIMLFMKGTAMEPSCGFSKETARKLMALEIDFDTVDISKDSKLRDAVKDFSDWPTFPQLFVEGQLFGGADIIDELISEGVLLEEITAKIKEPPSMDQDTTQTSIETIDGTCIPRKVWPEPTDDFDSCDHGHGHGAGDCERWSLDIKPPAEGGDTERWQLTLEPHDPSDCTSQLGNSSSCSHHHHGHGTSAVWL
jgi:Grx4 family monothiol glutaredoxin